LVIARIIASFLVLFILWTGTLLHDVAEITEPSVSLLAEKTASAEGISADFRREVASVDLEEHIHDAVVTLKDSIGLHTYPPFEKSLIGAFNVQMNFGRETARPLQRPPPQMSFGLPTFTFMTRRALLI
jgi:hypothetical protein